METVLPLAEEIEYQVKSVDNFSAILTASHEDAPPILQWDKKSNVILSLGTFTVVVQMLASGMYLQATKSNGNYIPAVYVV